MIRHSRLAPSSRGDDGIALVVAIALVGIVTVLLVIMVSVSIHSNGATGRDRQRSVGVMTAEGRLDTVLSEIQEGAVATLPCDYSEVPADLRSDAMTVQQTVTFYNAGGAPMPCSSVHSGVPATQARIETTAVLDDAIAGQQGVSRKMETLVQLRPVYSNELSHAIFGKSGITMSNNATIHGQPGRLDADIYTDGDITCPNGTNQHYFGSVVARGTVWMYGTCVVEVDVKAMDEFKTHRANGQPGGGNVRVQGEIESSRGDVTLGGADVGGVAQSSGDTTGDICAAFPAKCLDGQSLVDPQESLFPVITRASASAWVTTGGYQSITIDDCNALAAWLKDEADDPGSDMVIMTTCRLALPNSVNVVDLARNVAIFADGGIGLTKSVTFKSTDATVRNLYFIQPYDAAAMPCTDGIILANLVTVESTVQDLLYTPCNIVKNNNSNFIGQIYAGGTVTISNSLDMQYRKVPTYGGVSGASTTVEYYELDILYKREQLG